MTRASPAPDRSPPRAPRYRAGISASLIAEAVFISAVALAALLQGKDPWFVTRAPTIFWLGPAAVEPTGFVAGDVALGLLAHFLFSLVVGALYAALLPRLGISPVAGGLLAGAVLYLMGFWVLPLAFPAHLSPFWLPPAGKLLQAMAHALYGWVFGTAYARLVSARL